MGFKKTDFQLQVEFEDIDAGGVIHHPTYIKLCERARSRWFLNYGVDFVNLKKNDIALVIRTIKADYLKPVGLENVIVNVQILSTSEKSLTVFQEISPINSNRRAPYFSAEITLVAANYSTGRACALPPEVTRLIDSEHDSEAI